MPGLKYVRKGEGEPLVLVHGLGGSAAVWRPVLERLAREREVVALDLPGFGGSADPGDGFVPTAANLAGAVIGLCAELGIERPHVAGNSLGAWVGLEMAQRGEAASVCAISPAGLWRNPLAPQRRDRQRAGRRLRPLIRALLATARGRALLLGTTMAHPERLDREDAAELVLGYVDAPLFGTANAEMRAGAFEGAETIDVPVTLAWGLEDRIVGRPSRTRRPPGARYLEMPGWGHTPTWDDPEGVAALILEASSGAAAGPARATG